MQLGLGNLNLTLRASFFYFLEKNLSVNAIVMLPQSIILLIILSSERIYIKYVYDINLGRTFS